MPKTHKSSEAEQETFEKAKTTGKDILRVGSFLLLVSGISVGASGTKDIYDSRTLNKEAEAVATSGDYDREAELRQLAQAELDGARKKVNTGLILSSLSSAGFAIANRGIGKKEGEEEKTDELAIVFDHFEVLPNAGTPVSFLENPEEPVIESQVDASQTPVRNHSSDAIFRKPQA